MIANILPPAMDVTNLLEQVLMIVGGAAVGAFGSGLIAQLTTRSLTTKKLPPLPTTVIRGLGGVALGVLTAMCLWHGVGGLGFGGGNGVGIPGNGPGETKTDTDKSQAKAPEEATDKDKASSDEANPPSPESVLRLEVLTDDAVRKLPEGQQALNEHRYYRLDGDKNLLTLADLRRVIEKRVGDKPPLQRLDVVTGANSPDKSRRAWSKCGNWPPIIGSRWNFRRGEAMPKGLSPVRGGGQ